MERLELADLHTFSMSRLEHEHRYRCAAAMSHGRVLDLACGIGYGSRFLLAQEAVTEYVGIDVAEDTIEAARRSAIVGANFMVGSALDVSCADGEFDTIVSLETLEHLTDPGAGLREFRRVLAPGGVLIGSVPTSEFEDFCTRQYGQNPYHLQKFSADSLRSLLEAEFAHVKVLIARIDLVAGLYDGDGREGPFHGEVVSESPAVGQRYGSYFFVACQDLLPETLALELAPLLIGGSYFEAERLQVDRMVADAFAEPAYAAALAAKDRLVIERDAALAHDVRVIGALNDRIDQTESLLVVKDRAIEARDQACEALSGRCEALAEQLANTAAQLAAIKASRVYRTSRFLADSLVGRRFRV